MRTALYVLLALAVPAAYAGQTVYKWVDEKGVTHFSDQPVAGAEKVELSGGSNRAASPPSYSPPPPEAPEATGPPYSRFVVESPQQDESIINTGGVVTVRLAATPALYNGHQLSLYLDGARVEDFASLSLTHEFSNMPRGTHTVKAAVTNSRGRTIQETPPVTFHVRQESAAQPPVGPALRPNNPKRTAGNKLQTKQPTFAALNGKMPKIDPRTNLPVNKKPTTLPAGPKDTVGPKDPGPKDTTTPPTGK